MRKVVRKLGRPKIGGGTHLFVGDEANTAAVVLDSGELSEAK